MISHTCDRCGKEMSRWLSVSVKLGGAKYDWVNVGDLVPLTGDREYCPECTELLVSVLRCTRKGQYK